MFHRELMRQLITAQFIDLYEPTKELVEAIGFGVEKTPPWCSHGGRKGSVSLPEQPFSSSRTQQVFSWCGLKVPGWVTQRSRIPSSILVTESRVMQDQKSECLIYHFSGIFLITFSSSELTVSTVCLRRSKFQRAVFEARFLKCKCRAKRF